MKPTRAALGRGILLCSLMACHASPILAQQEGPYAALSLPKDAVLRCRVLSPSPKSPPGSYSGAHFEIGSPRERYRSIRIWFDSSDAPLSLTDTSMPDSGRLGTFIQSATVTFKGDLVGGFFIQQDASLPDSVRLKPPPQPPLLTVSQQRDARALAAWLRDRRCRGNE
jgi:hypothetical protein